MISMGMACVAGCIGALAAQSRVVRRDRGRGRVGVLRMAPVPAQNLIFPLEEPEPRLIFPVDDEPPYEPPPMNPIFETDDGPSIDDGAPPRI